MTRPALGLAAILALALSPAASPTTPTPARGADWFVAPSGRKAGAGTRSSPWDLESALLARREIRPGDTVWLAGGTYRPPAAMKLGYQVLLAGRPGRPIRVRARPGARATLDGGMDLIGPATHLEVRDLEITVSDPRPSGPVPPDRNARGPERRWGGLTVRTGEGCRFINLVIHGNNQGVGWWTDAKDGELYGCIIYDNGWLGTDRGHGHAVYAQNAEGLKTIADCIMTGGHGYSLHLYGSPKVNVDNFLVVGNFIYDAGLSLIGGYRPSRHIRVLDNVFHGVALQVGYAASYNEDCEIAGNVFIDKGFLTTRFRSVVQRGNQLFEAAAPRPEHPQVIVRPSKYDPHRAHVAVLNWGKRPETPLDLGGFLRTGDRFRLLNPRDVYGPPVLSGVYQGGPVLAPVAGEFAAFVLVKQTGRAGTGE
jgi:hypothetical protein